jgi:hypothetical protein
MMLNNLHLLQIVKVYVPTFNTTIVHQYLSSSFKLM